MVMDLARGWQYVEFTYTVTIKIKAPFLNPPLPTPPNLVCSSHPPMFFLEGTISYWKPSLPNVLYQWQWQWWLNSTASTAPSPTLHAHWACRLAQRHANHPCAWCRPHHRLQGIAPSISKHHTCQDMCKAEQQYTRLLMPASRLLANKEKPLDIPSSLQCVQRIISIILSGKNSEHCHCLWLWYIQLCEVQS